MKIYSIILAVLIYGMVALGQEQVDFKVQLPDSWSLESYSEDENLWVYESKDSIHQLTVSVLYYSKEPSHSAQGQFLEEYISTQINQISHIASEPTFTDESIQEYESAWVAKFQVETSDAMYTSVKAISTKYGIASFYFESHSDKSKHEKVSATILSTTAFAS